MQSDLDRCADCAAGTESPNVPETATPACISSFTIDLDTLEVAAERTP